jgi:hypothetical protein
MTGLSVPINPPTWTRLALSWLAAIGASAAGAGVAFISSALPRGGSGPGGEVLAILFFCLFYATVGTTVLGPPTLLILWRSRRLSARAFAAGGLLSGLAGMIALNAWGGYPQTNLFPETGALAGLCGALAFRRVWIPRARAA